MSEEHNKALAIAELKGELHGELKTIRAEYATMESRMDARLAENQSAMDRLRADMAQRDKDNLRWTVGLAIACTTIILGAMAAMLTLPTN